MACVPLQSMSWAVRGQILGQRSPAALPWLHPLELSLSNDSEGEKEGKKGQVPHKVLVEMSRRHREMVCLTQLQ